MRVLSVVFIFATLAIFGVMGCIIQCPEGSDTSEVCNKIGDMQFTTTKCESNNLIKCAMSEDKQRVYVSDGACDFHTHKTCERYCPNGSPVCGFTEGEKRRYQNLCTYMSKQNCMQLYELEENLPQSPKKLLNYGDC